MDDTSTVVPLDDELWAHVNAAVHAAHLAAETYLAESNVWSPKITMPKVGAFEGGWPKLDSRPTQSAQMVPLIYPHCSVSGETRSTPSLTATFLSSLP